MIDLAAVEAARQRIAPHIRKTPTLRYTQLSTGAPQGLDVTLKLELLQAAGSFKARGAMNRLLTLSESQLGRGIVTASGGITGSPLPARPGFSALGRRSSCPPTSFPTRWRS